MSDEIKNIDYEQGKPSAIELHDSVKRENPLPEEGQGTAGVLLLILGAVVLVLGGGQLFSASGGFNSSIYTEANYQPAPRPELGKVEEVEEVAWIDMWMKEGKNVYGGCVACHQASGGGMPGVFPPLTGSEWVNGGTSRLGAIMIHGVTGPLKVGGQTYAGAMPAWNTLNDQKLAQVMTYIRREFGSLPESDDGVVTVEMAKAAREKFMSHGKPFTEAELLAIPADENLEGSKVDLQTGEPVN